MPRFDRRPATTRLVVREHSPWRQWLIVGGVVAVVTLIAFGIYQYQMSSMPYDWKQLQGAQTRLESERDSLQQTIRDLRVKSELQAQRIVMLERGSDVDEAARKEVQKELAAQQTKISKLKEQLAFYRGIVSPEQSSAGLRVYQLAIHEDATHEGLYVYELVLIQALRHNRNVSGTAKVEIRGVKSGNSVSYKLADVATNGSNALTFQFKYFQKLDGAFRLPKGVIPTSVVVELDGNSDAQVKSTYKWSQVLHTVGDE